MQREGDITVSIHPQHAVRSIPEDIAQAIVRVRDHRVLLDTDLARLYGVTTKALLQAVRRNPERFPADFAFALTAKEAMGFLADGPRHGGRRSSPWAFTDQGVAMLSSVLRSSRAVQVNVQITRAFVHMRRLASDFAEIATRLADLEKKQGHHDQQIADVFEAIRQLLLPDAATPTTRIGFDQQ